MNYTLYNIEDFYTKIEKSLNPKVRKMMIYTGYQRDEDGWHSEFYMAIRLHSGKL